MDKVQCHCGKGYQRVAPSEATLKWHYCDHSGWDCWQCPGDNHPDHYDPDSQQHREWLEEVRQMPYAKKSGAFTVKP